MGAASGKQFVIGQLVIFNLKNRNHSTSAKALLFDYVCHRAKAQCFHRSPGAFSAIGFLIIQFSF
jgi:hypothetical protein